MLRFAVATRSYAAYPGQTIHPRRFPAEKIDSRSLYKVLEDEAKSMELKRDPFTTAPLKFH